MCGSPDFALKEVSKRVLEVCVKKYTATWTKKLQVLLYKCVREILCTKHWHECQPEVVERKHHTAQNISSQYLQIIYGPLQQYEMLISQAKLVIKIMFSCINCPGAKTDLWW